MEAVYAIRSKRRVELGYVRWSERHLLLLPSPGKADFEVFRARDEADLRERLVGRVALVAREEAVERPR